MYLQFLPHIPYRRCHKVRDIVPSWLCAPRMQGDGCRCYIWSAIYRMYGALYAGFVEYLSMRHVVGNLPGGWCGTCRIRGVNTCLLRNVAVRLPPPSGTCYGAPPCAGPGNVAPRLALGEAPSPRPTAPAWGSRNTRYTFRINTLRSIRACLSFVRLMSSSYFCLSLNARSKFSVRACPKILSLRCRRFSRVFVAFL
jgi:hypothetical protein